jgi:hypothetical protein
MDPEDLSESEQPLHYAAPAQDRFLPTHARAAKSAPACARCEKCGSESVSSLPKFSAGSGVGSRPFAEDVICNQCGHIAPFAIGHVP